jgi:hypothetical protein
MKLLISAVFIIATWLLYRLVDTKIDPLILVTNINGKAEITSRSWAILIDIWPIIALASALFATLFFIIGLYAGKAADKETKKQENTWLQNQLEEARELQETAESRAQENLSDKIQELNNNHRELIEFKQTLDAKSDKIDENKEIALIAKEEADRLFEEANELNKKATKKSHNATNALRRYKTKIEKLENKINELEAEKTNKAKQDEHLIADETFVPFF